MGRTLLRRLLLLLPLWLAVTFTTFALFHLLPGDPVALRLGPHATPERVAALRAQLGLDDPLLVQYWRFVLHALRGDLGRSLTSGTPVLDEIRHHLPGTVKLAAAGGGVALLMGLPAGILAALFHTRLLGRLLLALATVGFAMPIFWLAPLLIHLLGVRLRWLPVAASGGSLSLLLPALLVALSPAAALVRLMRASILDEMGKDYVRSARAKGLGTPSLVLRHVLPNALLPVVTVLGLFLSSLLTGVFFVEVIFGLPGLGRLTVSAVLHRDLFQLQALVLCSMLLYTLSSLAVDLLYPLLDPRIRYE